MQVISTDTNGANVLLTVQDLLTISNALNEVCNGLDMQEFSTRMGVGLDEALCLLKQVGTLYNEVERK